MTDTFTALDHSIYDGRVFLGRYAKSAPKCFEAFDVEGRPLGQFKRQKDACAAIAVACSTEVRHGR